MGLYNILRAEIECPRCKQMAEQQIDLYFGWLNLFEFKIGDEYIWGAGNPVQKQGGRPENGNIDGEGYVECELCKKDFFVKVKVRNDVIENVENDSSKESYIR